MGISQLKKQPIMEELLLLRQLIEECYQDAREIVADVTALSLDTFPMSPIASLEQVLDENWLPKTCTGL